MNAHSFFTPFTITIQKQATDLNEKRTTFIAAMSKRNLCYYKRTSKKIEGFATDQKTRPVFRSWTPKASLGIQPTNFEASISINEKL